MYRLHKILTSVITAIALWHCLPLRLHAASLSADILAGSDITHGNTSLCTLRDDLGFLWIGTSTGLCCFDGNGRPAGASASGLMRSTEGTAINSLFQTGDKIWCGTSSGINIFDRRHNISGHFDVKTKYRVQVSAPVKKMDMADDRHLWILTQGQGVFVYDTTTGQLIQNSRHGAFYSDMAKGADGNIYTVSLDGQLQIFSPKGDFISEAHLPDYVNDKHDVCMASAGGYIWSATSSSLYCLNTSDGTMTLMPAEIPGSVNDLREYRGGLMAATDNGLWQYDTVSASFFRPDIDNNPPALTKRRVTALSTDTDGSLLAVMPSGIACVGDNHRGMYAIPLPEGHGSEVTSLSAAPDGSGIWVGTDCALMWYDRETSALSPVAHTPAPVTSVTRDGPTLWIGTPDNGLIRRNPDGSTVTYTYDENTPYSLISNDVNAVYRTSYEEIFVLTGWGLCRYRLDSDNFRVFAEIRSHSSFVAMQEDSRGRLWTSTAANGLYMRRRPDETFNYFASREIGSRPVTRLFLDGERNLWAITHDHRAYRFDEEKNDFTQVRVSDISDLPVSFVEPDAGGALWVGHPGLLTRVGPGLGYSSYHYDIEMASGDGHTISCHTADGRVMFAADGGLRLFDPATMTPVSDFAHAFVQTLRFPYTDDNDALLDRLGLASPLFMRETIEIPYAYNTFTVCFSATHDDGHMAPVRFDYMLEGVDKDWVTGSGPEVTYTAVRPGHYTMLVRPASGDESTVRALRLTVLPPWYRTWWAYTVYAVMLAAMVSIIVGASRNRIRSHYHKRMEEARVQKERETYESKMRFFVNLVHEIRTPLTLISLPLEQMADSAAADSRQSEHIESMQRNLNYLLGITNQLLDFRKAEHDSEVKLSRQRVDVCAMLRDICSRFDHPLHTDGKSLGLSLPDGARHAIIDAAKTDRVIMNLVGNAMKYSRTRLAVSLADNPDGTLSITVADDGPGIPAGEAPHIFDTYYQISNDNTGASLGTGLGLAYARLIARAHGGDIAASSSSLGGASFTLSLPCGSEADIDTGAAGLITTRIGDSGPHGAGSADVTLLIADDNAELLAALSDSLSEHYRIVTARDGAEALGLIRTRDDIDMVISDFMMPRIDGGQLCREVKADNNLSFIPFIILTAKTGPEARTEGLECGADVYMEKPFTIRQLRSQIDNMLRTRRLFFERMGASIPAATAEAIMQSAAEESAEAATTSTAPALNRMDTEFLNELNTYINDNISDDQISIDVIAERMNMSRSSFYRKIKAISGMTPVDYLKNYRLDRAAALLAEGVRVTEVSMMVGFTYSSYFAKCFKAKFGVIPRDYVAAGKTAAAPSDA